MKTHKLILATIAFFAITASTSAQSKPTSKKDEGQSSYKTGIGLRGGFEGGLTIKHFIKSMQPLKEFSVVRGAIAVFV